MKASQLLPGDKIIQYTTFGGRVYIRIVTRVGFKHQFGDRLFASGIYNGIGYEYLSDGVKYINEIKEGHILHPDNCEVIRNGNQIN
jgi:hypothetical protein